MTLDGVSTVGKVEYRFDQQTVWVQWPEPAGRQGKKVKLTDELTDELWQELCQLRVGGWSSEPGDDAIPGTGTVTTAGRLSVDEQKVYVGKTLAASPPRARSSTGLTSKRCGCSGRAGRQAQGGQVKNKLSDEWWQEQRQPSGGVGGATRQEPGGGVGGWRWQKLRQPPGGVGGWSSQPSTTRSPPGHGDIRWAVNGRQATGVRREDARRHVHRGRGRVLV